MRGEFGQRGHDLFGGVLLSVKPRWVRDVVAHDYCVGLQRSCWSPPNGMSTDRAHDLFDFVDRDKKGTSDLLEAGGFSKRPHVGKL